MRVPATIILVGLVVCFLPKLHRGVPTSPGREVLNSQVTHVIRKIEKLASLSDAIAKSSGESGIEIVSNELKNVHSQLQLIRPKIGSIGILVSPYPIIGCIIIVLGLLAAAFRAGRLQSQGQESGSDP